MIKLGSHPTELPSLMQSSGQSSILALGGLNENSPYKFLRSAERYNPVKDEWEMISDMFWDRAQSGVVSTGTNLYVLGGRNDEIDNVVGNFNGTSGQWQEAPHMCLPEKIYGSGFALVRDQIMLIGGCKTRLSSKSPEGVTNKVYVYPLDTTPALSGDGTGRQRHWKETASLNVARGRHSCIVVRGQVYTIGGVDAFGKVLAVVEKFDVQLKQWIKLPDLPEPRRDFGCAVFNNQIFVVGGTDKSPSSANVKSCLSSVFVFDVNNNSWKAAPPMKFARQGLTCSVLAGKLYAIGGSDVDDIVATHDRLRVVERYDPDAEVWEHAAPMITPRSHLASGVVQYDTA